MKSAILLLGTNIGNRIQNLNSTMDLINLKAGHIVNKSSIYETEPWGFNSDQLFYNMAITIETDFSPIDLIKILGKIELLIGRKRLNKKGVENRIIDIDILSFENIVIKTAELEIPHPRMHLRKFTLLPLFEIQPEWYHPLIKKNISDLIKECNDQCIVTKI